MAVVQFVINWPYWILFTGGFITAAVLLTYLTLRIGRRIKYNHVALAILLLGVAIAFLPLADYLSLYFAPFFAPEMAQNLSNGSVLFSPFIILSYTTGLTPIRVEIVNITLPTFYFIFIGVGAALIVIALLLKGL